MTSSLTFGDELAPTVVTDNDDLSEPRAANGNSHPPTNSTTFAPHPLMSDSTSAPSASFYSATSEQYASVNLGSSISSNPPSRPIPPYPAVPAPSAYVPAVTVAATREDEEESPLLVQTSKRYPSNSPAASADLKIVVHSARKTWGATAIPGVDEFYMCYTISTVTTLPHFANKEMNVKRRFRDVVDLCQLLWVLYPGCFIPARPHRNFVEGRRMAPGFVQQRQTGIERFLNRIAAHPVMGRGAELRTFLEQDSDLRSSKEWMSLHPSVLNPALSGIKLFKQLVGIQRATPTPADVTQSASVSRDVYRLIHEQLASLTGQLPVEETPAQESSLLEKTQMLEELRKQLNSCSTKADDMLNRMRETGELMGDLGVALMALNKFEDHHRSPIGRNIGIAGQACLKAYKSRKAAADASRQQLLPLAEYNDGMPAVFHALHQRQSALLTALTISADLQHNKQRMQAAQLSNKRSQKQIDSLRYEQTLLEASNGAARAEYHRIATRNQEEIRSFHDNRRLEFMAMVRDYAEVQKAHSIQMRNTFVDMAKAFGSTTAELEGLGIDTRVTL